MMHVQLSPREKKILSLSLAVLAVYLVKTLVVAPVQTRSEGLDRQIRNAEQKLLSASRTIRKSQVVQRRYEALLEDYRQTQSDEEVMSGILTEIEATAAGNSLSISDLKPNRPKMINYYKEFSVSLVLEGDFTQVMEFVFKLQKEPYSYFVDEADISKHSPRTSGLRCRFVLSKVLIP
ncbi:MAG TPA: type 4a pilus biogenesis protein PilO [Candidatus Omnitrophota bacterium]|nr:type 4a pilus biogenesis protein PilO [Candidatus Omnitrophota bacterium]HPB67635.1 type 4a pilus biogenesis protein PilO [Candidatus Omnitrophota bacterium]HQO58368.1 type 4a pilus biogenesis protein PilO [Candidatus Omnitrophota bacterium]HQP11612.1 type 4a pilus biogenesis protein PilO [Candidatus Omnitrophota bacterium]